MTHLSASDLASDTALAQGGSASIGDYFQLLKPRVMSLVVFTAGVGLFLAPGHLHPLVAATAIFAIALGAGASGAINMWYDRDIDAVMARTAARPIPSGRIEPDEALSFGVLLSIASVTLMAFATNIVAAGLLAFTILFYVLVYTMWLKRSTPQNIVIGGAAGAFPPMVAWAAVTGDVSWASASLFLPIFLWTPPHFWALALYRSGDYARAGVPMLPVVAGEAATRRQMLAYTLVLLPASLLPSLLGVTGWLYAAAASLLGLAFVIMAVAVWRAAPGAQGPARRMFAFSLLYLALLFAAMPIDRIVLG
jgi:protoheme IX farnesyltransferase